MIGLPLNNCFFWRRQHAPVGKSGVKAPHMGKVMGGGNSVFCGQPHHKLHFCNLRQNHIEEQGRPIKEGRGIDSPNIGKKALIPLP